MATNTDLLVRLRDLHEELASINQDIGALDQVDDETIDALGQLVTDVSGLVDQTKEIAESDESVVETDDLLERISKFESEHPSVTRFLSQMTDLLAMLGI